MTTVLQIFIAGWNRSNSPKKEEKTSSDATLINEYIIGSEGIPQGLNEFTGINDIHNNLKRNYDKIYMDYGIIHLARLVALEVKLKSYLQ